MTHEFDGLIEEILRRHEEPVLVFEGDRLRLAVAAVRRMYQTAPPDLQFDIEMRLAQVVSIRLERDYVPSALGWAIGRSWFIDTLDLGVRSGREMLTC